MNNQERYKNIFDSIESNSEITLDSLNQRKHALKKKRLSTALYSFAGCAALFLGSNAVSYAKTGEFWVSKAFKTGNGIEVSMSEYDYTEEGVDSDNCEYVESVVEIATDDEKIPDYYSVEDGRLYFVFGDTKTDITDECNENDYFKYEFTDEESYKHVIIVGGTVENPGWAEYIYDKDGNYVFSFTGSDNDSDSPHVTYTEKEVFVTSYDEESSEENYDDYTYSYYNYDEDSAIENPQWLTNAEKDLDISTNSIDNE